MSHIHRILLEVGRQIGQALLEHLVEHSALVLVQFLQIAMVHLSKNQVCIMDVTFPKIAQE